MFELKFVIRVVSKKIENSKCCNLHKITALNTIIKTPKHNFSLKHTEVVEPEATVKEDSYSLANLTFNV